MDLPEVQERWPKIKKALEKRGFEPMAISAVAHTNVKELLWKAAELLKNTPAPEPETTALPVYRTKEDPRAFTIQHTQEGWVVSGASIERAAEMTYWEYEGSVRRFQRLLGTLGIEKALREAGIKEGDTVFIKDYELEWQD
jgi:GTP-binding protein